MSLVKLWPIDGVFIAGVPHVEQEVSEAEAKRLLAYNPPAFTTDPPPKAAAKPTGPANAGPSDSKE